MGARLSDSALYGHLWGTPELREIFEERPRIQDWLDILSALAEAQAELEIVPVEAARAIAREARVETLDLGKVAEETRRSGHSTLGLIRVLREILPSEAKEWVYYGITVQDLTDTWMGLAMKRVGSIIWRDLRILEEATLSLAERHRDTLMAGRTHGQIGAPITFGLKAAGWADEIRRHLERLREGAPRWLVGQLGGAVGTLGFFGELGPELRRRFCARLSLEDPGISWTSSRDRVSEFVHVLALVTATLARIGNEIYQLQRSEIGELREPAGEGTVGSITMPHKRNPEASEHLVTLSRLVRAQASVVLEGMVQEHERDGRGWKAEWVAFPEACLLAGTALALGRRMLEGLQVDAEAMRANLERLQGLEASERVLAHLAPQVGKHRAQALLQEALGRGRERGATLEEALMGSEELRPYLRDELMASIGAPDTGSAGAMVDGVLERLREARAEEAEEWV